MKAIKTENGVSKQVKGMTFNRRGRISEKNEEEPS